MFGSNVKKSWEKERDKHNDTKELNLKEFVYIGESLEKILWLHNKANNVDMKNNVDIKFLGHAGYDV